MLKRSFENLNPSFEPMDALVFKRQEDEEVLLVHGWEYGSLIMDIIGIEDNKITIKVDEKCKSS